MHLINTVKFFWLADLDAFSILYIVNVSIETLIWKGFLDWQTIAHALETQNKRSSEIYPYFLRPKQIVLDPEHP